MTCYVSWTFFTDCYLLPLHLPVPLPGVPTCLVQWGSLFSFKLQLKLFLFGRAFPITPVRLLAAAAFVALLLYGAGYRPLATILISPRFWKPSIFFFFFCNSFGYKIWTVLRHLVVFLDPLIVAICGFCLRNPSGFDHRCCSKSWGRGGGCCRICGTWLITCPQAETPTSKPIWPQGLG